MKKFRIVKNTGEKEPFSERKYKKSLRNSGASDEVISEILDEIKKSVLYDGISTSELYKKTYKLLGKKRENVVAGRYSLKKALLRFGPTGYPFEKYIASLLSHIGYETIHGPELPGRCVTHEVDVIAKKDNKTMMIECKFHNETFYRSGVQISLYVQGRFEDINAFYNKNRRLGTKCDECWLVTNTKFSDDAVAYGECMGMKLLSWNYPRGEGLAKIIESNGWHPISCLTRLSKKDIDALFDQNIIVCRDLLNNLNKLKKLNFSQSKIEGMKQECEAFVALVKLNNKETQ